MKNKEDILYDLGLGLDPQTDSFILQAMQEYADQESNRLDLRVKPASTAHQKIYDMKLHEVIDISEIDKNYRPFRYVMRVAGGWIYANYDTDEDIYTDKLFIPFDNDMQKTEFPY